MNTKQVLVVREQFPDDKGGTFGIRKGKYGGQCAHASFEWIRDRLVSLNDPDHTPYEGFKDFNLSLSYFEVVWLTDNCHKKIVCKIDTESALMDVYNRAKDAGLNAYLIQDLGLTEFKEPTYTAVGIGPNLDEDIDQITKTLKLA